jgi:hypothetical protein
MRTAPVPLKEREEKHRRCNRDSGGYVEEENWKERIALEGAGIKWFRPGLRTNSSLLEVESESNRRLFGGMCVRYIAVGDCKVQFGDEEFDFQDGDIVATAREECRDELSRQIDNSVLCGLISSSAVPRRSFTASLDQPAGRGGRCS